jgi:glycosyltransferase involved in cell wall biosynthesis
MESFWARLAEHFAATHQVVLAYPSISRLPSTIEAAPLKALPFSFSAERGSLLGQMQFLRRHRIRIIYLTDRTPFSLRYIGYRLAGVRKIIVHDHTPGVRSKPTGLRALAKSLLHRLPWSNVDALIGATPFVTRRHVEVNRFPASRCHVAQNGLPTRARAEAADVRTLFSIPQERQVVVTVGRAHRIKGIHFLLDALAELVVTQKRGDVHLLHIGDGPDLEQFKLYARSARVESYVSFAGQRDDVRELLRGSDLAIHASEAEVGYSLAILEYMEAGLPVLVANNPSVCGATDPGKTGLHFVSGDVQSAVEAIRSLLDQPELARSLGAAAESALRETFSLSRTHRQLIDVFENI